VGREVNYRNPYGSNPSPAALEIPTTLWYTQAGMPVSWQGLDGLGNDVAAWATPTFDLRPDLRSSQNMAKSGVPIWDTAARLYVQIFGLTATATATQFLRMEYRELANTTFGEVTQAAPPRAVGVPTPPSTGFPPQTGRDPVVPVTPFVDITSELMLGTNQPNSIVVVFEMLGEGYPIRYWQAQIRWLNMGGIGPPIVFQAAVY
tara:strand:- start:1344 stop:1955 length:612 start_codon:yes stop_codon:yes gene_type:complete